MINASELRIGNWVRCHFLTTDFKEQILEIRKGVVVVQDGVLQNGYSYENIDPIPLTPEILKQLGFVVREGYSHFVNRDVYVIVGWHNSFQVGYELDWDNLIHLQTFKYVHQLQNLYFSLTGEELEIKL